MIAAVQIILIFSARDLFCRFCIIDISTDYGYLRKYGWDWIVFRISVSLPYSVDYLKGSSTTNFVPSSCSSFFFIESFSISSFLPPISLTNLSNESKSKISSLVL